MAKRGTKSWMDRYCEPGMQKDMMIMASKADNTSIAAFLITRPPIGIMQKGGRRRVLARVDERSREARLRQLYWRTAVPDASLTRGKAAAASRAAANDHGGDRARGLRRWMLMMTAGTALYSSTIGPFSKNKPVPFCRLRVN